MEDSVIITSTPDELIEKTIQIELPYLTDDNNNINNIWTSIKRYFVKK